jgi:hypothetical protein
VHNLTLGYVELHEPGVGPIGALVDVELKLGGVGRCFDDAEQFGVVGVKLCRALQRVRKVIDEEEEQKWSRSDVNFS